jgi:hypothetical protein
MLFVDGNSIALGDEIKPDPNESGTTLTAAITTLRGKTAAGFTVYRFKPLFGSFSIKGVGYSRLIRESIKFQSVLVDGCGVSK